jgi:uncharacterized protein
MTCRKLELVRRMANQYSDHKMKDDPLPQLLMIGVGLYVAKLWFDDYRANQKGKPAANPLPGAAPAPMIALLLAALGGLAIVGAETWAEYHFGVSGEQSNLTALFAAYTLIAAVIEEIVFRGFIVVQNRGRVVLWLSVVGASVAFAALHPFLWTWEGGLPWSGGKLTWHLTTKAWVSTVAVFIASIWFYVVRFWAINPQRSLLPCFAAHGAKNLAVIAIKAVQGHLVGLW